MRAFSYRTIGLVLDLLREKGCVLSRSTYYRLIKRLNLPPGRRTFTDIGPGWLVYSEYEVEKIIERILNNYNIF